MWHCMATSIISNCLCHVMLQLLYCWWCYPLVLEVSALLRSKCAGLLSDDARRSMVVVTWIVINMRRQQASIRGTVWCGIYMEISSAWRELAGKQGWVGVNVEPGELSLDICVDVTAGLWHPKWCRLLADCIIWAGWVRKMEGSRGCSCGGVRKSVHTHAFSSINHENNQMIN